MNTQNTPVAFTFEESAVRIIPNADNPLFVAKDVACALGYAKPENAISRHCKRQTTTPKRGGGFLTLIEESDVYRLIFGSQLESAEKFQDWVFEEVLPSIRKNGAYGALKPADEIRYLNQRLQLLRELNKVRDALTREKVYEQFKHVSDKLGFDTPPLADFRTPHGNDHLDEGTRATIEQFFAAIAQMESLDIAVDHHRDPAILALNLNEVLRIADDSGIPMPSRPELLRALPQSVEPRFIGASVSVSSQITKNLKGKARTQRCYLFRR